VISLLLTACITPDLDDFYTDAAPKQDADPGDIINARRSIYTLDPVSQSPYPGVNAWQVIYQSINATGEPIAVSGTVIVPTKPWPDGKRPVISYAVGTRGLGDACAPSFSLSQGTDYEGLHIASLLLQGWAVAISDYEGLGTPGVHTYMAGPSMGHVVLDMARAAQRLPGADLSADAPIGIIGFSQGGAATGWAAELASTYAPELNIVGVAPGGVPANLIRVGEYLDGTVTVAFALMSSVGLDAAYDELNLEEYMNEKGRALNERAANMCILAEGGVESLLETGFTHIDDYTTTNPLESAVWQNRLDKLQLGRVAPQMPVFLYQPEDDSIIPIDQATQLRKDWCSLGVTVDWLALPGDHVDGMVVRFPLVIEWMRARFNGLPALSTCWFD
jgi:hypothetical protein